MAHHAIIPAAGVGRRMEDDDPRPKSLRPVAGRPILLHTLDALAARGTAVVTLIVGFEREQMLDTVGTSHRGMRIEHVPNTEFATTEHGWSLFLARDSWLREQRPVLFMDADNVFDPRLLDRLLAFGDDNTVLVDPGIETSDRDEELVLGRDGIVSGFVRGRVDDNLACVGGFVGMNRFRPEFMRALFDFMGPFFERNGRGYKYERVFDALISENTLELRYRDIADYTWVNVNHADELALAERIVARSAANG